MARLAGLAAIPGLGNRVCHCIVRIDRLDQRRYDFHLLPVLSSVTSKETAMGTVIELPTKINAGLASDIEKESTFVSPFLDMLRVSSSRDAVELEIAPSQDHSEVIEKVQRFLDAMLKKKDVPGVKVFYRNERRDNAEKSCQSHEVLFDRRRPTYQSNDPGSI